MNISAENRTAYETDMMTRIISLEFDRAKFLARPSVMLGLIPKRDYGRWRVSHGDINGYGDSPDKAMQDFDKRWGKDD